MAFRRIAATIAGSALVLGALVVAPSHASSNVTLQVWGFGNVFEPKIVMKYGMIQGNKSWTDQQNALIRQHKLKVLHPNVTLVISGGGSQPDAAFFKLSAALPGNAAPDVAAIEMAYMGQTRVKSTANQFINLDDKGARAIKSQYLPFRYAQGQSVNGHQIGIPTDVGGLAVAYRTDLFKKAGLPTGRSAVAKLWPSWEKFIATGKRFQAHSSASFIDSSGNMFQAILNQGTSKYSNPKTKKYDYVRQGSGFKSYAISNPAVKRAFKLTADAGCTSRKNGKCSGSIGTKIPQYNTGWGAAIEKNAFATVLAPAWALDYIKQFAPKSRGKWDVAAAPGVGGNLGGSMLTIPKKADNVTEAWKFIKWYLAPQQQLDTFKQYGLFPTTYKLYNQPAIKGYKDRFFNSAPLGVIYSNSAVKLKPILAGPLDRAIDNQFGAALSRVSFGNQTKGGCGARPQTTEAAWCQAVSDIGRLGLAGK
jgi:cellobiose transport system substrate-binding protein